MRELCFFFLLLIPFLFLSCGKKEVDVRKAVYTSEASVIIDGRIDEAWQQGPLIPIENLVFGEFNVEDTADFSAIHSIIFDKKNLYFLVLVKDERIFVSNNLAPYNRDGFEIFFDLSNDKKQEFELGDDLKYCFHYDSLKPYLSSNVSGNFVDVEGVEAAFERTNVGYIAEVKIPFEVLKFQPSGNIIGYNITVFDNDTSPLERFIKVRESVLSLTTDGIHSWKWTSVYSNLEFPDTTNINRVRNNVFKFNSFIWVDEGIH